MTANEPPNDSSAAGVDAIVGGSQEGPKFSRVLIVLAAPVLNPIIFAVVLSLLFGPVYAWLGRRGLPRPVALVTMLPGLTLRFVAVAVVFDIFPETRWLARFMGMGAPDAGAGPSGPSL